MDSLQKPLAVETPIMIDDMSLAPLGVKLLAVNPGGVLCIAVLNKGNVNDFIEWCPYPKRAKAARKEAALNLVKELEKSRPEVFKEQS